MNCLAREQICLNTQNFTFSLSSRNGCRFLADTVYRHWPASLYMQIGGNDIRISWLHLLNANVFLLTFSIQCEGKDSSSFKELM